MEAEREVAQLAQHRPPKRVNHVQGGPSEEVETRRGAKRRDHLQTEVGEGEEEPEADLLRVVDAVESAERPEVEFVSE